MMASSTASTTAMAIDVTVRNSVQPTPRSTGLLNRYSPTVSHWNTSLVTSALTTMAASTTTTAPEIHRPGYRTGIAWIRRGSSAGVVAAVVVVTAVSLR